MLEARRGGRLVGERVEEPFGVGELIEPGVAHDVDAALGCLQGGEICSHVGAARTGLLVQGDHARRDLRLNPVDRAAARAPITQ